MIMIKVEAMNGAPLEETVKECVALAKKTECCVSLVFSGVHLCISKDATVENVIDIFNTLQGKGLN